MNVGQTKKDFSADSSSHLGPYDNTILVEPVPDLNDPPRGKEDAPHNDQELDELLSSFQRISNMEGDDAVDDDEQTRKIGLIFSATSVLVCLLISMIGLSINCNGLGSNSKKSWIKSLIERDSPFFIGIQETKRESFDSFSVRSLWLKPFVDFVFSSSDRASAGLITLWDSRSFSMEHKVVDRDFIGIIGSWLGISSKVGLINIYAPQANSQKVVLWDAIKNLINSTDAIWILFGDFNVVHSVEERIGSIFDQSETNHFNDFILRVGLVDIPLNRRRFTRLIGKERRLVNSIDS
ncbi:RNA-directed DNA polymerase, eukaryota [Tanacetum coccineum]